LFSSFRNFELEAYEGDSNADDSFFPRISKCFHLCICIPN